MKNRNNIIDYFNSIPEKTIMSASDVYEKHFSKMSGQAFFKAMERLEKEGFLRRVFRGVYCRSKDEISNEDLLNFFFGEDNDTGMFIGNDLYRKYDLTEEVSERIRLISTVISSETLTVGNIYVKYVSLPLTYGNTRIIEALEILQNYDKIPSLNKKKFAIYVRQFARGYDDESVVNVIKSLKYKKRTIAFMKKIVDTYGKENSLQQFLSYSSKYKVPAFIRLAK